MLKIRYTNGRLKTNLNMGLFFLAVGIILLILSIFSGEFENINFVSVGIGQLGAGIMMLLHYYYEYTKQYLTLKNGILTKNSLLPKRITLSEIKSIRAFAGDLKLKTEKSEFVIDTQIIAPDSLEILNSELKKLDVEWS